MNMNMLSGVGYVVCLEDQYSVRLLSYCITSGALGIPDLLLSYSMKVLPLHNT